MPTIEDQDRFFSGQLQATLPKHLITEGNIARLINGRFIEGAITNAIGFDELDVSYTCGDDTLIKNANVTYGALLKRGDVQLGAPLQNVFGKYLVVVISGVLFRIDLSTLEAVDITPRNAYLPESSSFNFQLSYLDNDGGVYGSGAYAVVFNYPNRPIFVDQDKARISNELIYETPVSKFGATAGDRACVISGQNLAYFSDPLGGASSAIPLLFQETLDKAGAYTGQIFTIGSALDLDPVTCVARMPRLLGPAQDFLGHNLLISTKNKKYIIPISTPRADWETIEFIVYAGTSEGIAGPLAVTNVGSAIVYTSSTGRIKTFFQDQERENSLSETYFDEDLGQYLNHNESSFYFRSWYRDLDHSRSLVKFSRDRVYATVYPYFSDSIGKYNNKQSSYSNRALAIGSLASDTRIGPQASIAWEGFYDWVNPASIVVLDNTLYIISKDIYGRIRWYKENNSKLDDHTTRIYTRGYFSSAPGKSKSLYDISLYFRKLAGTVTIRIYSLVDNKWMKITECEHSGRVFKAGRLREKRCKTNSWSIPLRVEIDHNGCRFELESIRVGGETHKEEKSG